MLATSEWQRLYQIMRVYREYNLQPLLEPHLPAHQLKRLKKSLFWIRPKYQQYPLAVRLRLALESLGPVWIKFGQMLSTRRDILDVDIADQLALLQDQVQPFDGALARQHIESQLGDDLSHWFERFDEQPLASASIAQVHTAFHKASGREVVLKVIRPDIRQNIQADIKLMYRLARLAVKYIAQSWRLKPVEVVQEYEKTLLNELDLRLEAANAIRLRKNFLNSEALYIPEVLTEFTRETLMVSERIYGISVADVSQLQAKGFDLKRLAERGVTVFFTQVFRDSFFHADMHPGNIFVSHQNPSDPQWIGLDCGIVGTLNEKDKRYLAENFLAFFSQDYRRVAQLHVASEWVPKDVDIDALEQAIRQVCEPIFAKPLCEISFGQVLMELFEVARSFDMQVQPQLVLLQKTLLYVEGLGRQLYPQLDLWATAKPFLQDWMKRQVGPQAYWKRYKDQQVLWQKWLPDLPELLYDNLRQGQLVGQQVHQAFHGYQAVKKRQGLGMYWLAIGATLMISTAVLYPSLPFHLVVAGGGAAGFCWGISGWIMMK